MNGNLTSFENSLERSFRRNRWTMKLTVKIRLAHLLFLYLV